MPRHRQQRRVAAVASQRNQTGHRERFADPDREWRLELKWNPLQVCHRPPQHVP